MTVFVSMHQAVTSTINVWEVFYLILQILFTSCGNLRSNAFHTVALFFCVTTAVKVVALKTLAVWIQIH
jgi:hypothetical protein